MFQLDLQSRVPLYEQMKNRIVELVAFGALQKDEQLPSVRSLAKELGVNPNTVQKAYQELERQGILYSVPGRGSFVADPAGNAGFVRRQAAEELRRALLSAKSKGLTREGALELTEEIYRENSGEKEAENHD